MAAHSSCRGSMRSVGNQPCTRPVGGSTSTAMHLHRGVGPACCSMTARTPAGYGRRAVALSLQHSSPNAAPPSTACKATGVLAGPPAAGNASAAAAVGEGLLRRWLGVAEKDNMPIQKVTVLLVDGTRQHACDAHGGRFCWTHSQQSCLHCACGCVLTLAVGSQASIVLLCRKCILFGPVYTSSSSSICSMLHAS